MINIVSSLLTGITLYNQFKETAYMGLTRVYESLSHLISPKFYMFFEEYSMPLPMFSLNMDRNLIAKPLLIYNADEYIFFPYIPLKSYAEILIYNKKTPLSVLSMEIINADGTTLKDLTDFVEKLRYIYIPEMEVPTVSNIVAAWCITHSIPLNRSKLSVRYITSTGTQVITSLTDMTPLDDESPPASHN
jgi:hypothetical protein